MKTVFIDSSVLFSACASKTGASALIMAYCIKKRLKGFISRYVIEEVKRNVIKKLDKKSLERFIFYIEKCDFQIIAEPTTIKTYLNQIINDKDAPILIGAIKSGAKYLITLDKKDFMKPSIADFAKPLKILFPGDFVNKVMKLK